MTATKTKTRKPYPVTAETWPQLTPVEQECLCLFWDKLSLLMGAEPSPYLVAYVLTD